MNATIKLWFFLLLQYCLMAELSRASHSLTDDGVIQCPILFNDDGDFTFVGEDQLQWRKNLTGMLDQLKSIPAGGLVYSLGTGGDIFLYPSKAGSSWGWRSSPVPEKLKHIRNMPLAVQAGVDGVRWAAEDAKNMGMLFIPAMRMNDAHYIGGRAPYLESEFWIKNHDRLSFGISPYGSETVGDYKDLLDYSHPEVREYRLAVIREAINRYKDKMDGFLLDFMRSPVFFKLDKARESSPLMTALVADVHAALLEAEGATGRKFKLLVRVPPTIKNCEEVGLDIKTWVNRGLVQVLIPSQIMTLSQDMPIREFSAIAKLAGVKVYASIYQRGAYTHVFSNRAPVSADYSGRSVTAALLRGAALNYADMGVDGYELYNFNLPVTGAHIDGFGYMSAHGTDLVKPRVYAITPSYFLDYFDTFEPKKQIPLVFKRTDQSKMVKIYVGENAAKISNRFYVGLRLGLKEKLTVSPVREVSVNGYKLEVGKSINSFSNPDGKSAPRSYFQVEISSPGQVLRRGWNDVEIQPDGNVDFTLTEVQIGVTPRL